MSPLMLSVIGGKASKITGGNYEIKLRKTKTQYQNISSNEKAHVFWNKATPGLLVSCCLKSVKWEAMKVRTMEQPAYAIDKSYGT